MAFQSKHCLYGQKKKQYIFYFSEKNEEGNEMTDETVTKPTTEEVCKAIDTLLNFSMFTQNGEIGRVAMNASKLFEKELCESMKETSISNFFRL